MLTLIAAFLFSSLTSNVRIAALSEPGERLVLSGTVYRADGRTPAANVVLLAYHTNAKGIYPQRSNSDERGSLQGRLQTDAKGRYRIDTIRPGGYPGNVAPAHIHLVVQPEGKREYYIDEVVFDDDPRVNAVRGRKGFAVVKVVKRNGVWAGTHNIVLRAE
ncbi:MAG: dioxygenase family protein [Thermoanaerobaculia bacterium]